MFKAIKGGVWEADADFEVILGVFGVILGEFWGNLGGKFELFFWFFLVGILGFQSKFFSDSKNRIWLLGIVIFGVQIDPKLSNTSLRLRFWIAFSFSPAGKSK